MYFSWFSLLVWCFFCCLQTFWLRVFSSSTTVLAKHGWAWHKFLGRSCGRGSWKTPRSCCSRSGAIMPRRNRSMWQTCRRFTKRSRSRKRRVRRQGRISRMLWVNTWKASQRWNYVELCHATPYQWAVSIPLVFVVVMMVALLSYLQPVPDLLVGLVFGAFLCAVAFICAFAFLYCWESGRKTKTGQELVADAMQKCTPLFEMLWQEPACLQQVKREVDHLSQTIPRAHLLEPRKPWRKHPTQTSFGLYLLSPWQMLSLVATENCNASWMLCNRGWVRCDRSRRRQQMCSNKLLIALLSWTTHTMTAGVTAAIQIIQAFHSSIVTKAPGRISGKWMSLQLRSSRIQIACVNCWRFAEVAHVSCQLGQKHPIAEHSRCMLSFLNKQYHGGIFPIPNIILEEIFRYYPESQWHWTVIGILLLFQEWPPPH